MLLSMMQVLHPICSSLRTVDITDTSITNVGLQQLCRRIANLSSLGEYSIRYRFTVVPGLLSGATAQLPVDISVKSK